MPSPFPGMDPYLEGSLWTTVHTELIVEIGRQLAPRLRPKYIPLVEKRFVVTTPGENGGEAIIYPDVAAAGAPRAAHSPRDGASGAAVAAPLRLTTLIREPVPQHTLEIRFAADRRLVTAIEVLSPTNKRGEGREEYLGKRDRLLLSSAHLMEVDLLRTGQRPPMREALPPVPYFVFLSRAGRRPDVEAWPVALDQPLPPVPVPLLPGDADVPLDLQAALSAIYDAFSYDLLIDYSRPPEVPLPPEQAAWAEQRLRACDRRGRGA